jgi:serine/threonine protein kinase
MMWRAQKHAPYMPNEHADMMWAEDNDPHDSFDTLAAGLNQRMGSLPKPTIEHKAIKRRRQLGAGGFAVVFEADIPHKGKKGVGWSRTCATKVFSFIAGMGERQTNFFKNWLHELKVLDYLSERPECGVVDFYGFSLQHEEAEAKIVVQICMELMRGGSLRDNLLVLKRKGEKVPLAVAFNIIRQIACALRGLHEPIHDIFLTGNRVSIVHRDLKPENVLLSEKLTSPQTKDLVLPPDMPYTPSTHALRH